MKRNYLEILTDHCMKTFTVGKYFVNILLQFICGIFLNVAAVLSSNNTNANKLTQSFCTNSSFYTKSTNEEDSLGNRNWREESLLRWEQTKSTPGNFWKLPACTFLSRRKEKKCTLKYRYRHYTSWSLLFWWFLHVKLEMHKIQYQ